jgi:hypothetical protein
MLYIALLFWMGTPRTRFRYIDDVAILAVSPNLNINSQILSRLLQEAISWGIAKGITFAPDKYELIHFSQLRIDEDLVITPLVLAGLIIVSELTNCPYLCWLGILFDKKLRFKHYI